MTIQRHVTPARSNAWGHEPARGTVVIASDNCVTVMNGRLQTGVSKNGKAWQRWENNERFFYSTKTGYLRVFHKTRKNMGRDIGAGANRYQFLIRDITASDYMPYPVQNGNIKQTRLEEFLMSSLEVNIAGFQRLSNFADSIHYAAFPILREAGWRPVQGIGAALRQPDLRSMVEIALGKSRYRKDIARSLAGAVNLSGLQFAMAVKSFVPADWLVPALAGAANVHLLPVEIKELRAVFSRIRPAQQRALLADFPNIHNPYILRDTLMGLRNFPDVAAIPRDTTWAALHDTVAPQARIYAAQEANGPIPQEGPTLVLDGLQIDDLVLESAKETRDLAVWGERMSHCIGSYGREAISGRSHLFALKRGSDLIANLEVTPTGQVRQFYGRFNKVPAETITVPVRKAIEKKLKGEL